MAGPQRRRTDRAVAAETAAEAEASQDRRDQRMRTSCSSGQRARDRLPGAMEIMGEAWLFEKHEGTLACDDVEPVSAGDAQCIPTDGSSADRAIKPDMAHARPYRILHDGGRLAVRRHDEDRAGSGVDGGNAREALEAVDGESLRVDGNDVVSAAAEFIEKHPAEVAGLAGDSGERNPFLRQERFDRNKACARHG